MSLVLAFGTFDHFHPGHAAYLEQAASLGDELIVVIARDVNVERIKNKRARQTEKIRKAEVVAYLKRKKIKGMAVLGLKGDRLKVLSKYHPDIIALGYDQRVDEKSLSAEIILLDLKTKVKRLKPHYPEKYKSSLMR
ncbi:adenylyltransferase/cytidyltransferase family protein [Patescibacteria group bacterium]|nr:adenylyltransferase/cytidyltransferase family protein [Patescibacteria group bacterium]